MSRARVVAVLSAGAALLAACTTGPSTPASPGTVTRTEIVGTHPASQPPTYTPAPATSVAPFPRSGKPPSGERRSSCPYIKAGLDSEPTSGPNVADIEGDRVGAVTVLTRYSPVGCRFYFSYSYAEFAHEAVADIEPHTLATPAAATVAMIAVAKAGSGAQTVRDFAGGLTGIRYRTRFFGPDGARDWAFVFAKGRTLVVVHTQQTNASLNAQLLAVAVAGKF